MRHDSKSWFATASLGVLAAGLGTHLAVAQGRRPGGAPPRREPRAHVVTQSSGKLDLAPAEAAPPAEPSVLITVEGDERVLRANGIPAHATGAFPGRGNPNAIAPQPYLFRIPAHPEPADSVTPLGMHDFGVAVNGVPFDPGAAEWYLGQRDGPWRYEPLSGALPLGLDRNHAHVQPTGAYHYHGLPTLLLEAFDLDASAHSKLVGWAADGFPIYAVFGHEDGNSADSAVRALRSSFRLKSGERPSGPGEPGGTYYGTFVADYEYVEGLGDLDECNGRTTVTPEFPDGTYAYFLTETWPVIPRAYRGTPSEGFQRRGPPRPPSNR